MQRRFLLVAGLIALAASMIGTAVQTSITDDTASWDHMSGYGHMGWRGQARTVGDGIEGANNIEVTTTEFAFTPGELTVRVGEPINLTLVSAGDLPHDPTIPDLGVRIQPQHLRGHIQ